MTLRRVAIFALIWATATVGLNFAVSVAFLESGHALNDSGLTAATRVVWALIEELNK